MADQAIDFLTVVDVAGRDDRIYVFAERRDAERFSDAINGHRDEHDNPAFVSEQPVNAGEAAERLLAAERGDVLEDLGWTSIAEGVREEGDLSGALRDLLSVGSEAMPALKLVRHWIDVDRGAKAAPDALSTLPDDVKALIAATFARDSDTIEAPPETWERLHSIFVTDDLVPPMDEDGITRIGGDRG
jgi:hypothetical protein